MKNTKNVIFVLLMLVILIVVGFIYFKHKSESEYVIDVTANNDKNYEWVYSLSGSDIVNITTTYKSNSGSSNGNVCVHYKIKANKEGSTIFTLEYKNTVTNEVEDEQKYNVFVDEKLKLHVEKNN